MSRPVRADLALVQARAWPGLVDPNDLYQIAGLWHLVWSWLYWQQVPGWQPMRWWTLR